MTSVEIVTRALIAASLLPTAVATSATFRLREASTSEGATNVKKIYDGARDQYEAEMQSRGHVSRPRDTPGLDNITQEFARVQCRRRRAALSANIATAGLLTALSVWLVVNR